MGQIAYTNFQQFFCRFEKNTQKTFPQWDLRRSFGLSLGAGIAVHATLFNVLSGS